MNNAKNCDNVNPDEIPPTESEASLTAKKALTIETSDGMKSPACLVQPLAHPIQTKQAEKKSMLSKVPDIPRSTFLSKVMSRTPLNTMLIQ